MSVGNAVAAAQARNRAVAGTRVVINGVTYNAVTKPLSEREHSELLEGTGINAAAADLRVFNLTPPDFPKWPASQLLPGSQLTWHGIGYSVLLCVPEDVGGVAVALRVSAYRTPQTDAATDETPAEAAAEGRPQDGGKRKSYLPPDNTGS